MMRQEVKLSFYCNQDWNKMQLSDKGRFCQHCFKEVIDYTSFSRQEVLQKLNSEGEVCGRFKPEQIDASLIKPIEFKAKIKLFTFLSSLVFSSKAIASNTNLFPGNRTEQHLRDEDTRNKQMFFYSEKNSSSEYELKPDKPFLRTSKRQFYWTRKFPFVKAVRRNVMGWKGPRSKF
jgi:hypothetical protein